VAQLAVAIAAEMGLPEETIDGIRLGALIHEIGNITIPAEILSTPRVLSPAELDMIRSHARAGVEIIGDIEFPWPIAQTILHHHEKLDGSGYPDGLAGDEIPLETRVVTVACVVEAMASHRPYREALGVDAALQEIRSNRGKSYDPAVVDACVRVLERSGPGFW
jgi:HD-GYP domain-containing protein (c-di-GMP phosphodiesterase class II)